MTAYLSAALSGVGLALAILGALVFPHALLWQRYAALGLVVMVGLDSAGCPKSVSYKERRNAAI